MATRRARRCTLAHLVAPLAVVSSLGVACGTSDPGQGEAALPEPVEAMWAESTEWVAVSSPDPLLVPGPSFPASVELTALIEPRDGGGVAVPSGSEDGPPATAAAQTLYADPSVPEPWTGRAVMVGRVAGDDVDGSFLRNEGEPITIQGREGRVGQSAGSWFASWSIPIPSCDVCHQEAFVIARGVDRAGVLAIAETVRQEPTPGADASTLPSGLRAMGSLWGAGGTVTLPYQQLDVRAGDEGSTFTVWAGDPRLHAHLAFWDGDDGPIGGGPASRKTVANGAHVIVIEGPRLPRDDRDSLARAARGLVPSDRSALDAAMADAAANLRPLPATVNLCEGWGGERWATLSDAADGSAWAITFVLTGPGRQVTCQWLYTSGGGEGGGTGGGGPLVAVGDDAVRISAGGFGDDGLGPYRLVAGDIPATAVRVQAETDDGPIDGVMAEIGPEPNRRWFAVRLREPYLRSFRITAFDADGLAVASGSTPS